MNADAWRATRIRAFEPDEVMRSPIIVRVIYLVACGNDSVEQAPDRPPGKRPEPRVIAGGGLGDGAIHVVVNLYVIDDAPVNWRVYRG